MIKKMIKEEKNNEDISEFSKKIENLSEKEKTRLIYLLLELNNEEKNSLVDVFQMIKK